MKIRLRGALMLASAGLLACCVPGPGGKPGPIPPRLVEDGKATQQKTECRDPGQTKAVRWDNAGSFGEVPKELQARGDAICSSLCNDLVATGYHPQAEGLDGVSLPGGGFFCAKKHRD